jgi:hydroxypyruvate isomerase
MPRLTANISFLFMERPFLERFAAAKAAGFDRVECHYPYEFSTDILRERLSAACIALTGLNTPPGDLAAGNSVLPASRAARPSSGAPSSRPPNMRSRSIPG